MNRRRRAPVFSPKPVSNGKGRLLKVPRPAFAGWCCAWVSCWVAAAAPFRPWPAWRARSSAAGSVRQYLSWLHLTDAVRAYRDAIDRGDFQGGYVATSPQPATNAQFMLALRSALHRPWSPPVPGLAVRLGGWIAGINSELALTGQRCAPRRLMEQGFAYEFPDLRKALAELVGDN